MTPSIFNLLERAIWTGVQTSIAILSADGLGWLEATPLAALATAGVAGLISALKTFSQERLRQLGGEGE